MFSKLFSSCSSIVRPNPTPKTPDAIEVTLSLLRRQKEKEQYQRLKKDLEQLKNTSANLPWPVKQLAGLFIH